MFDDTGLNQILLELEDVLLDLREVRILKRSRALKTLEDLAMRIAIKIDKIKGHTK